MLKLSGMKKLSLFFVVIAIISALAFTRSGLYTIIYGKDQNGVVHAIDLSDQNILWECEEGSDYCTYSDPECMHPLQSTKAYQFALILNNRK